MELDKVIEKSYLDFVEGVKDYGSKNGRNCR